jgi:hypothetical protein
MSDEAKRYNGWSNYETWCVHLWLTNEEGSYRYWKEEAERHRKEDRESERSNLAEQIRSEMDEAAPTEKASVFSDLLNAALSEVDWYEIADAFLEELPPEEDRADEDEETDEDDEEAYSAEEFERVKRERIESPNGQLFELGQVVTTPGALAALSADEIRKALARHHRGDWGEVGRHDWRTNEEALTEGFRLFSVYRGENAEKFWVITEADRSSTCVLLPEDY